jgi:hypothetical protein
MTYEKGLFAQADPGIVSGSTIERKKMSTKTIYKRIALVAVAALGAGVLSVAPASAAAIVNTDTAMSGSAGTNNSIVVSGSATALVVNTVTAATATSFGFRITNPVGTVSYIGTGLANADVGVLALTGGKVGTLTLATAFTATTGKYVVQSVAGTVSTESDSSTKIDAAIAANAGGDLETISFFVTKATPSFSGGTGRTVTSATAISQDVNGVATLNIVADNASASYSVSSTGVGAISSAFASNAGFSSQNLTANGGADAVTNVNGVSAAGGVTWTPTATTGTSFIQVKVSSAVAGSQVVSVTPLNASGTPGTPVTATVTWGATPAPAVGTTTSILNIGAGTAAAADETILVSKSATGQQANIVVTIKDQAGNPLNNQTVSATISGAGLIAGFVGNAGGVGTARVASVTITNGTAVASIGVNADGTSGVGTITISVGTTVVATETVGFFDVPATVTAVQNHKVLSTAGGTAGIAPATNAGTGADIANTPSVILTIRDKNGLPVTNLTAASTSVSAVSSDTTVMSETIGMSVNLGTGAANTAVGTYNVRVSSVAKTSGSTATLKFKVMTGTTTFIESAPLTYTLGGAVASVALSLNKASYTPGEAATATLTVKDAAGNAAFDGDHANITAAALTSSLGITGTLAFGAGGTTVSSLGGVAVSKINAPGTSGTWTVSGTTGTGPATAAEKGKALTATATVSSSTDISALTTLVNSLIAKINALNKLVIKIQKKVRA